MRSAWFFFLLFVYVVHNILYGGAVYAHTNTHPPALARTHTHTHTKLVCAPRKPIFTQL